jgi:hypothetical protein
MTQISRPFQVLLVVFVAFVAVWFAALRNHNATTGGGGSSASVSEPARPAVTKVHAATAHTATAHTAHATTVHKTTAHTTTVHRSGGGASTVHRTVTRTTVVKHAAPASPASAQVKATPKPASKPAPAKSASPQAQVESELQAGKTVLILFWNPHGAEDAAVRGELPAVQHKLGGKIAVHYARAGQVGQYGTVTHSVQVNQTPTLLIVNPHGQARVLTGLTDAFAIEQAIRESNRQQ